MGVKTDQGYLMLADFSGYTSFMAGAELGHAQPIARELLELISTRLSSVFRLLEIEGDALFVYAPASGVTRGETLLETIESTYVAFRDRLGTIKRHATCGCVACNSVQTLDLKFLVHFGEFVGQRIVGNFKLIGSDVNIIHRLAKNSLTATKGWSAYALFTDSALTRMDVQPVTMHRSVERYDHIGEVVAYSFDLHQRHEELRSARKVLMGEQEADVIRERVFRAPPAVVWDWLNDPHKRSRWMKGTTWTALSRPAGRTGPGSSNHCAHGKGASVEQITDWRPFDYFSTEVREGPITIRDTVLLAEVPEGTRLSHRIRFDLPLPRVIIKLIAGSVVKRVMKLEQCWDRIEGLLREESAARGDVSQEQVKPQ